MIKADLHIHTTVSDGSDSMEQIVKTAEAKGLDAIAITDHDTTSHLERLPKSSKVKVLGGVELSAVDPSNNMRAHILAYHVQNPAPITRLAQPLLEARNKNSEKQAQILIQNGCTIDMSQLARADGTYLYKQHIMDYLVSTAQVGEMFGSFYYSVFKNGGICNFDVSYIDVFEAVKAVKAAGGLAVLAHSGQQQNFYLIPALCAHGLDGLELYHHSHSAADIELICKYAKKYGLFLTGGSDYHGRYEPQIFGIGDFISEESGAKAICQM